MAKIRLAGKYSVHVISKLVGTWYYATLQNYLGKIFSVELRLLKERLCVLLHWGDDKTTTQKRLDTMIF